MQSRIRVWCNVASKFFFLKIIVLIIVRIVKVKWFAKILWFTVSWFRNDIEIAFGRTFSTRIVPDAANFPKWPQHAFNLYWIYESTCIRFSDVFERNAFFDTGSIVMLVLQFEFCGHVVDLAIAVQLKSLSIKAFFGKIKKRKNICAERKSKKINNQN